MHERVLSVGVFCQNYLLRGDNIKLLEGKWMLWVIDVAEHIKD